jgi:hypothetical protein
MPNGPPPPTREQQLAFFPLAAPPQPPQPQLGPPDLPPPLSARWLCELAKQGLAKAIYTWVVGCGKTFEQYSLGSRSLTNKKDSDAFKTLKDAIDFARQMCGPGALPPQLASYGRPSTRRGVLNDV